MSRNWRLLFSNSRLEPQVWLRGSLSNGQCFNWNLISKEGDGEEIWQGVLGKRLVWLRQAPFMVEKKGEENVFLPPIYYDCHPPSEEDKLMLERYFRSEVDLQALYEEWSAKCMRFAQISRAFRGIRILRQDKFECIISFITSANNNIKRIHGLLDKFRREFGTRISHPGEGEYFSFPTLQELAAASDVGVVVGEEKLREMGFGYRAKYIAETVRMLSEEDGALWKRLNSSSEMDISLELCKLSGVGRKVADCISLFAFDKLEAIPVDVHVLRIAKRDYNEAGQLDNFSSMNKQVYAKVNHEFVSRFGENAGWAHSVLFTCELAGFRERLPVQMLKEMDAYKAKQKRQQEEEETSPSPRKQRRKG